MLGETRAEAFEHRGGAGPVFQFDQRRGRVVVRIGADAGVWRDLADAQELFGRGALVAGGTSGFGLFVDRGGELFGDALMFLGFLDRHHPQQRRVGGLGSWIVFLGELRVGADGERGTAQRGGCGRLRCEYLLSHRHGLIEGLDFEQVFGRTSQYGQGLRMLRMCGGETLAGIDRQAQRFRAFLGRYLGRVLLVGQYGGVSRFRRTRMRWVVVGGPRVLLCRFECLAASVQRLTEQEVVFRRRRIVREHVEQASVPGRGGQEIAAARLWIGRCLGMVILRQIVEVLPQCGHDLVRNRTPLPVRGARIVGVGVTFLLADDQLGESALAIGIDHAGLEFGRQQIIAVPLHKSRIRFAGVVVAFLFEQLVTEAAVQQRVVGRFFVAIQITIHGRSAAHGRERQAGDTQHVLHQRALAARRGLHSGLWIAAWIRRQVTIENREQYGDGGFVVGLLVQRPGQFVLGGLVERRFISQGHDGAILGRSFAEAIAGKQQLTPTEMAV